MIELVIFDCDGVLVDSEPISCRVMAEVMTEAGLPTTTEECMRDYMGRSWADSLRMIEQRLGEPVPAGFTEEFRGRRDEALEAEVEPVDGIAAALDRIEHEFCVASSGAPEKIRLTLGTTGLLDRFEGRIFSAVEVERGKPHPDLFLHAARALGHRARALRGGRGHDGRASRRRAPPGCSRSATRRSSDSPLLEAAGATATFTAMGDLPACSLS